MAQDDYYGSADDLVAEMLKRQQHPLPPAISTPQVKPDVLAEMIKRQAFAPMQAPPQEFGQLQSKISQYPQYGPQYKAHGARRVLGDIAGGAIGALTMRPDIGEQMAARIHDQPYTRARQKFGYEMEPYQARAAAAMQGLEAQKVGSEAEEKRTRSLGNLYEMTPEYALGKYGAQPQTYAQLEELKRIEHPIHKRGLLGFPFQGKAYDPETGQVIDVAPPRADTSLTFDQRVRLHAMDNAAAYQRALLRKSTQAKIAGYTPAEQATAENLALKQIKEKHPEFSHFIGADKSGRFIAQGGPTPGGRVERWGDIPRVVGLGSVGGVDPKVWDEFMALKEMTMHEILKRKQPTGGEYTSDEEGPIRSPEDTQVEPGNPWEVVHGTGTE